LCRTALKNKAFLVLLVDLQALMDRRAVYAILREHGIPTPPGLVFVNRDSSDPKVQPVVIEVFNRGGGHRCTLSPHCHEYSCNMQVPVA
jgi:hypothetical protein